MSNFIISTNAHEVGFEQKSAASRFWNRAEAEQKIRERIGNPPGTREQRQGGGFPYMSELDFCEAGEGSEKSEGLRAYA